MAERICTTAVKAWTETIHIKYPMTIAEVSLWSDVAEKAPKGSSEQPADVAMRQYRVETFETTAFEINEVDQDRYVEMPSLGKR
jgi:hypothetical protein